MLFGALKKAIEKKIVNKFNHLSWEKPVCIC